MKIIFSPSKEMRKENILKNNYYSDILFKESTFKILEKLKTLSKDELASIMKINGALLEHTIKNIDDFENIESVPSLSLYNGVAFKELEIENYSGETLEYLEDNLYILSAFYGLSKPSTLLKPYRLDMTMKLFHKSLYSYWKEELNNYIQKELKDDFLINLASGEFSKMIDRTRIKNIINIDFKEKKDGKYSSISTYSKQARGKFLNILAKNRVFNINELKNIEFDNYTFNLSLSDDKNFIFSR